MTQVITPCDPAGLGYIAAVDSEWDPEDHTRLACVTVTVGTRIQVLRGAWDECTTTIYHGRDPRLAEILVGLFDDESVLTVWHAGATDVCTYSQAPGLGLPVVSAYYAACLAGRVSDVYQRDLLLWTAFPMWQEWWQVGTHVKYIPPTLEGRSSGGTIERPFMGLDSVLYRWTGEDIRATKQPVPKPAKVKAPRTSAKPRKKPPTNDARQQYLPGTEPHVTPAPIAPSPEEPASSPPPVDVRRSFGPLVDVPLELWDEAHKAYAAKDTLDTLKAWRCQALMKPTMGPREITTGSGKPAKWYVDPVALATIQRRMPEFIPVFRGEDFGPPGTATRPNKRLAELYRGERSMVTEALPAQWMCTHGGLYADREYVNTMIARYEMGVDACKALLLDAGVLVADPEIAGESAGLTRNTAGVAKLAHSIFSRMDAVCRERFKWGWAPLPTKKGERAFGKRCLEWWADWDPGMRKFAACSTKVLRECLDVLAPSLPQHSTSAGTGLVDRLAKGEVTREQLDAWLGDSSQGGAGGPGAVDAELRTAWAFCVWYKCNSMLTGFLRPIAATLPVDPAVAPRPITPRRWYHLITGRWSLEGLLRQNGTRSGGSRESMIPAEDWSVFLADLSQIELFGFGLAIQTAHRIRYPDACEADGSPYIASLCKVLAAGKDAHIILSGNLFPISDPVLWVELSGEILAWSKQTGELWNLHGNASAPGTCTEWAVHDCLSALRAVYKGRKKPGAASVSARLVELGALVDAKREESKRLNYGLGGMMRPAKFIITQRMQGDTSWTLPRATVAYQVWRDTWWETEDYEWVLKQLLATQGGFLRHLECDRLRGGLSLTSLANTLFQTPVAQAFKAMLRRVWAEATFKDPPRGEDDGSCWNELRDMLGPEFASQPSPLYGSIVVAPIHDEIVSVAPKALLVCKGGPKCHHDTPACGTALARKQVIMRETAGQYLPGLNPTTEGAILPRFSKG